jgi:hypothetical protein
MTPHWLEDFLVVDYIQYNETHNATITVCLLNLSIASFSTLVENATLRYTRSSRPKANVKV